MGMPDWLPEAREFCQRAGIEVYGWGPDTLTVKADSPEPAVQVASGLRPLGFEPVKDEDDAHASTLLLSRNPAATRAKQNGSSNWLRERGGSALPKRQFQLFPPQDRHELMRWRRISTAFSY